MLYFNSLQTGKLHQIEKYEEQIKYPVKREIISYKQQSQYK